MKPHTTLMLCLTLLLPSGLIAQDSTGRQTRAKEPPARSVILTPTGKTADWRDFAYLAAIPAGQKLNDGRPVVMTVDPFGSLRPEMQDFLRRYRPEAVYLLDGVSSPEPPQEGLIAHWPMDAAAGMLLPDHVGQQTAHFRRAAVWQALAEGAYHFDGRTLDVDDGNVPGSGRSLTVAFWMKTDAAANQVVMEKLQRQSRAPGWQVMTRGEEQNHAIRFRIGGGDAAWHQSDLAVNDAYTPGEWVHVTCTHEEGVSKIYLNGTLKAERKNITWATPNNSRSPLVVGSIFTGALDDVRIYHRVLDFVEIQNLPGGVSSTPKGLVGYWPMDETAGTTAGDRAGKNNLTFVGTPSWQEGQLDGAIHFAGREHKLRLGPGDGPLRPVTIQFQATSNKPQESCLLRKLGSSDQTPPWSFFVSKTDLVFQSGSDSANRLTVPAALPAGKNVSVRLSLNAENATLTVDGGRATSVRLQRSGDDEGTGNSARFDGVIDDVRVLAGILPPADPVTEGQAPQSLGQWRIDPQHTRDSAKAEWVQGTDNQAIRLNGINEYIDCGAPPSDTKERTIAFWVKPEGHGCVASRLPYRAPGRGWALTFAAENNTLEIRMGHETEARPHVVARQAEAFLLDTWVHVACAMSEEQTTLYLNGQQVAYWKPRDPAFDRSPAPLLLGSLHPGVQPLKGVLDDVRLYDRFLSEEEVLNLAARLPDPAASPTLTRLPIASPQQASRLLAATFWKSSRTVVCSKEDDYDGALVASGLAARLKAPLVYMTETGLPSETKDILRKLQTGRVIVVGEDIDPELDGAERIHLADAVATIAWMEANGLPVNYLAAANPQDRTVGRVRKTSLMAPLLAAGREGAVALLDFATEWKVPFTASRTLTQPVVGLPESHAGWKLGELSRQGETRLFAVTRGKWKKQHRVSLLGSDGTYEGPRHTGDRITMGERHYTLCLNPQSGSGRADVWLTWPGTPELQSALRPHYEGLKQKPEYLCLLGEPDVIPFALVPNHPDQDVDLPSDAPIANADGDPFLEFAVGRLVGEDLYSASLTAARGLAYPDLIDPSWSGRFGTAGWDKLFVRSLKNVGFEHVGHHTGKDGPLNWQSPLREAAVLVHGAHSSWMTFGGFTDTSSRVLLSPALVESGGCSTMRLNKDPQGRSAAARLLRNGAVCVIGNSLEGIGKQILYRTEFYNGLAQRMTVGQAHRYAMNRVLLSVMEKGQDENGKGQERYQYYIRMLFGDPAVRVAIPTPPEELPAHLTVKGQTATFHPPQRWLHRPLPLNPEWNSVVPLVHDFWAYGVGKEDQWRHDLGYGVHDFLYVAEVRTGARIAGIKQLGEMDDAIGWTKKFWIDEHGDGTRSIFWRIRPISVDMVTGDVLHQAETISYQLLEEH